MSIFSALLDWLRSLFFSKQLEIALVGLQNSGKTSLVNVLAAGEFSESMIPTVYSICYPLHLQMTDMRHTAAST